MTGVQTCALPISLLKLVEGTKCRVPTQGNRKTGDTVEIDTTNILFIAGGAFVGLDEVIKRRTQGTAMGFGAAMIKSDQPSKVLPDDLVKYGMIPEFVGRFPVTVKLDPLSLEDYSRILIEPKNSLLNQMQFYFQTDNIDLTFSNEAVLTIAQKAMDLNIGARGLKTVLEHSMMPFLYNITSLKKDGIKQLTIDETMITSSTTLIGET